MAPAKLSPADKKALIERFRTTTAPIAALAEQFGVSVSTVSRILRGSFPPKEYEQLREQRSRQADDPEPAAAINEAEEPAIAPSSVQIEQPEPTPSATEAEAPTTESTDDQPAADVSFSGRRRRRRTAAESDTREQQLELTAPSTTIEPVAVVPAPEAAEPVAEAIAPVDQPAERPRPILKTAAPVEPEVTPDAEVPSPQAEPTQATAVEEALELTAEDLRGGGTAIEDADEFGDDDESEDEELVLSEDDLNAADDEELTETAATLELLPLGIAPLPRTSYVVVDRTADLVTCSLTTLTELGTVEADHAETQALPLFDNPRTAKRFCKRNQRVIKVPDSQLFLKTTRWLQAKGIHCLLIDGQVYALDR